MEKHSEAQRRWSLALGHRARKFTHYHHILRPKCSAWESHRIFTTIHFIDDETEATHGSGNVNDCQSWDSELL